MYRQLTRKALLGTMAVASLTLVAGCSTNGFGGFANASGFTNVGASAPLALPSAARIDMPAIQALSGQGIFYFDDNKAARLYVVEDKASRDQYLVKESFADGVPHGLPWGNGAEALLYEGVAVKPENILYAQTARDGHLVVSYGDHADMKINVKIEAYNVEGLMVRDFLRTRGNQPTLSASFINPQLKFPKGSIAYAMTLWVDKDEVLVPNLKGFTGTDSIADFSRRFSANTPYCLRFLPGNVVQPMAMAFKDPITPKVSKVKGKTVEEDQDGRVQLYAAKKNTVFCGRERNEELADAKWTLGSINGTRVLEFDFPGNVPAASFGMTETNRRHLGTGVAEMKVSEGRQQSTRVVPVYVWHKGAPVRDSQFRFNDVAAKTLEAALNEAQPLRAKWEAANENDVIRRARAIDAANAPKVVKTLPSKAKKSRSAVKKAVKKQRAKKK